MAGALYKLLAGFMGLGDQPSRGCDACGSNAPPLVKRLKRTDVPSDADPSGSSPDAKGDAS